MPDNDFEKQVHEKMVELHLLPSEAVWEQVESRLHHKEKRRRWIIWFPLLLAGLSLAGYFAFRSGAVDLQQVAAGVSFPQQKTDNKPALTIREKSIQINDRKPGASKGEGSKESVTENNSENSIVNAGSHQKDNIPIRQQHTGYPDKSLTPADSISNQNQKSFLRKQSPDNLSGAMAVTPSYPLTQKEGSRRLIPNNNDYNPLSDTEELARQITRDDNIHPLPVGVNQIITTPGSINIALIPLKETQTKTIIINRQRHQGGRWQWGLSFQGGMSSVDNGSFNKLFSGVGSNLNFSGSNQSSTNPNPSQSAIYYEPYPTRASAAYSAGAFIKRKFPGRFALSLGINYTRYSTATKVGKKVDSLVQSTINGNQVSFNQYFTRGNSGNYTNKYHYIEVPITLETTLTRKWKRPLYWDLGFSLSRLIAGNALHFENNTGIYYKDYGLLNKTQFNVSTGLPVKLFSNKKFEWVAGPQLQYGFSNSLNNNNTSVKHFLFLGLKANLALGKN